MTVHQLTEKGLNVPTAQIVLNGMVNPDVCEITTLLSVVG